MPLHVAIVAVAFAAAPADPADRGSVAYPDQPVPGHTGGFGEPTCEACHFDGELNPQGGRLTMAGWPERPVTGRTYPIVVRLISPGMERAGFQLAVRTPAGAQAGRLAAIDERAWTIDERGVTYAQHTVVGSQGDGDVVEWRLRWTPPRGLDEYVVHAAANAGNGDASALGDAIYTRTLTVVRR